MGWKDWPRWLRFGIFFMIISLGLELIDYILAAILCTKDIQDIPGLSCGLPLRIFEYPIQFFGLVSGSVITNILITVLFYFVLGAVIGFVIDKIKYKK